MTFTQLNSTTLLKNFLRGWLLVLGLKECLVECATLCLKSEVILPLMYIGYVSIEDQTNLLLIHALQYLQGSADMTGMAEPGGQRGP